MQTLEQNLSESVTTWKRIAMRRLITEDHLIADKLIPYFEFEKKQAK